jgi:transposase InsO family protein
MAVPDQTAETCAFRILYDFIAHWGCPLSMHIDQGSAFESKLFKDLCQMLNIRETRTSFRIPRGNGQVERFNRNRF